MLSVVEAQAIVARHARPLPPVPTALTPAALGRVLAEDIASDLDSPPYDKSLMDGYAVRSADLPDGKGVLTVVEEVTAGRTPSRVVGPREATRIMTGAPMPSGADAVVMIERTQAADGNRVSVDDRPPRPGQNVLPRGQEMRGGETILRAGAVLRPQEIGLLAAVGRATIAAYPAPAVAVIPTGDEIVDVGEQPGPGQIRNSNGPMLGAQVARAGGVPHFLGIARDRLDSLRALVGEGLRLPVLILSGGVSAGKLDLVPGVLEELGVTPHFHKVAMKPGKPVYFGTRDTTLVFGLPGNPVSSLVCFELFVRPALRRLAGHTEVGPAFVEAALADDFAYRTDRPTYYPVRLEAGHEGWTARPIPWFGSPDLRAIAQANAFAVIAVGEHRFQAGQRVPVMLVEAGP